MSNLSKNARIGQLTTILTLPNFQAFGVKFDNEYE